MSKNSQTGGAGNGRPSRISRRTLLAATGATALAAPQVLGASAARAHTPAGGPDQPALPIGRDLMADTWVAVDGLGRSVPTHAEVGPPRSDKFVGVFYFLWLGQHSTDGPYDISKIITASPDALNNADDPAWGPAGHFHHWAEPYFGYYVSDDTWVIRKHAEMLVAAGVDSIFFDVTNGFTYANVYNALLDTFAAIRADGDPTPQVAFLAPFGNPTQVVNELYSDLYQPGLHSDLWFRWDGKPLILADPAAFDQTAGIRDFFTFRKPQPSYFVGPSGPDEWGWLEVSPQHAYPDAAGHAEQVTVGVAQNAVDGRLGAMSEVGAYGRSYHDDTLPVDDRHTPLGLNAQEQWDRALQIDPEFIFVTGWNEWVAQRLSSFNGVELPVMFVDEFDWEHSRDIEPCRGGTDAGFDSGNSFQDAYYYQLVSNIRRFKGARPLPAASAPHRMPIDGHFGKWKQVEPEYRDHTGDTAHRDHPGWGDAGPYVNTSGRNDIVAAKVARDEDNVYFYVRTRGPITPSTDRNWMLLLIDITGDPDTGWEGFDLIVNRQVPGSSRTLVEASRRGWSWRRVAEVDYAVGDRELEVAIPRRVLGLGPQVPVRLDFKWVDNMQIDGDILDLVANGDAAPSGRFRYRYLG